jgi:hypothetical protein
MLEFFDSSSLEKQWSSIIKLENQQSSLEKCLKTLRELPLFGYSNVPVDFRYPKIEDIRAMPKNQAIKAIQLNWK